MSSLESSKNIAGIGSILLIFPFASIIGIILVFVGMKGMSDYYKEPEIYHNALWGLIFGIIGGVAFAAGTVLSFAFGIFSFGLGSVLVIFGALVVVFVFYILMAMHFRRAFSLLAQRTGEHSFETAGTLLWWGAILTIIFVGLFLIFIAWIFATIAFFSVKTPIKHHRNPTVTLHLQHHPQRNHRLFRYKPSHKQRCTALIVEHQWLQTPLFVLTAGNP